MSYQLSMLLSVYTLTLIRGNNEKNYHQHFLNQDLFINQDPTSSLKPRTDLHVLVFTAAGFLGRFALFDGKESSLLKIKQANHVVYLTTPGAGYQNMNEVTFQKMY